ncbi:MAG: peptide deformylase, partial [Methylocapsa sp.]|nr:peptide deformylase [Methylocapsa sp.]
RVRTSYLDREGREQEIEAAGILATCLQHEVDHLNGVLFIDRLSRLKREMLMKKFRKNTKQKSKDGTASAPAERAAANTGI